MLALKGEKEQEDFETVIDFNIDAYIPPSYIKNEAQKMEIYKRIAAIETDEDAMDMRDELIDRFGDVPRPVENLLEIAQLKALAHSAYVTELTGNKSQVRLSMYGEAPVRAEEIPGLVKSYGGALKFTASGQPGFTLTDRRNENREARQMLEKVKILLNSIKELLV